MSGELRSDQNRCMMFNHVLFVPFQASWCIVGEKFGANVEETKPIENISPEQYLAGRRCVISLT